MASAAAAAAAAALFKLAGKVICMEMGLAIKCIRAIVRDTRIQSLPVNNARGLFVCNWSYR